MPQATEYLAETTEQARVADALRQGLTQAHAEDIKITTVNTLLLRKSQGLVFADTSIPPADRTLGTTFQRIVAFTTVGWPVQTCRS